MTAARPGGSGLGAKGRQDVRGRPADFAFEQRVTAVPPVFTQLRAELLLLSSGPAPPSIRQSIKDIHVRYVRLVASLAFGALLIVVLLTAIVLRMHGVPV